MEENLLTKIEGTYDHWVGLDKFAQDAEVADEVKQINCDTRDFALGWSFEHPKSYIKASCGLEEESNKGISKLFNLFTKSDETRMRYTIKKTEIISWLKELCLKTGGYDKDWRYLSADLKNCDNWQIKYIRFVRNNKFPDEFIVCNSYFTPIEFREVINHLKKDV